MILLSKSFTVRWAAGNGDLAAPDGTVLEEAAALEAMPKVGTYELELGGEMYPVERVGSRYCDDADLREYGERNGDGFNDESRYPDEEVWAAIQSAEEAIESGCERSFCLRAIDVQLAGTCCPEQLPIVDARSTSDAFLVSDRMAVARGPVTARVEYGARCGADVHEACVRLAASYLRPRAGAENARGQSVDGVYISYELATGDDGSWTGLPFVDAVIERRRSRRVVIG